MIAIITGDVVHSRALAPEDWLTHLKNGLEKLGKTPKDWEIYRGDSFQFKTTAEDALFQAVLLKAWMKYFKEIDLRMSIGVGTQNYESSKITEGNGPAFERSGEGFDALGKKNLSINTPNESLNAAFEVMCDLALLIMDKWSEKTAEVIYLKLKNPELNQKDIAIILDKKGQGNISETLKRGGFDEVYQFINYYHQTMKRYVAATS
ncbi:MAG TPA: hypothetical protein VKY33_02910 [Flavobacterium sp.]|nr:hypothetical protein [Flavobacterium sp.]